MYRIKWDNNDYTIEARNNILIIQDNNKASGEPCRKFYKVEEDSEWAYKVMKTKIKADGGAEGLYNFLKGNIENNFAKIWTYNCITKILNTTKEAY